MRERHRTTSTPARAAACGALERGYCLMVGGPKEAVRASSRSSQTLAPGESGRFANRQDATTQGRHRAGWLPPLRAVGRRPLRQDDPQRHRVRPDAGVRRRLRHPASHAGRRLGRRPSTATTSTSPTIAEVWRRGSVVASWLLDLTAMALAERPALSRPTPASSRTRAKAAGRCWRPSKKRCRPTCWRPRCSRGSGRARITPSREKLLSAMRKQFGGHVEPPKTP